jgi:hypothetical protein
VELHLMIRLHITHDLAKYPFDRRAISMDMAPRRQQGRRRFKLLGRHPQWKKDAVGGYSEDDSVLTVRTQKGGHIDGHLRLADIGGPSRAVFVRMNEVDSIPSLLVLLERNPRTFVWNVLLVNWIVVAVAHVTFFMEFWAGEVGSLAEEKSLLAEQTSITLTVLLALVANKFAALEQDLPKGLGYNTLGDYYFAFSFVWVAFIAATNAALFIAQTHYDWEVAGGSGTHGIDFYSGRTGMAFIVTWTLINVGCVLALRSHFLSPPWAHVVNTGKEDQKFGSFVDDKTDKPGAVRRRSCVDIDTGFVRVDHLDSKKRQ